MSPRHPERERGTWGAVAEATGWHPRGALPPASSLPLGMTCIAYSENADCRHRSQRRKSQRSRESTSEIRREVISGR
jgi:hypothetical protein